MAAAKSKKKILVASICPLKSMSPGIIAKRNKKGDETTPHIDPKRLRYFVKFFSENNVGITNQKGFNEIAVIVHAITNKTLEIVLSVPFSAIVVPK